jgi:hypothetical protein
MIRIATEPFNWGRAAVGAAVGLITGALGFGAVIFFMSLFFMFLTSRDPMNEALKAGAFGGLA